LYFVGRVSARPFGTGMGMIAAALYVPYSRGSVTLRSRDPEVPPAVSQRLLTDPRDAKRMVIATRLAEALINEPSVRDCFEEAYLLPRDPPPCRLTARGAGAAVRPFAAARVLGAPPPVGRAVSGGPIGPGRLTGDRTGSGPPLTNAEILAASGPMFHPSCTCAIGRADDPMAVVDPKCRVYGVAGLRVADASVMPSVPGANTHFPTIMIAERGADFIRAARPSGRTP